MKNSLENGKIKSISFILGTNFVSIQQKDSDSRSNRSDLFDFINLNQNQILDISRGGKFE